MQAMSLERSENRTVLSIDAMGGDLGPAAVVAGISHSAKVNPDLHFILHGPEAELRRLVNRRRALAGRVEIRDAPDVVTMDDKPSQVLRTGRNTSMWSALEAVRACEAEVCVSCGNTGALMAMSMIRLRKLEGVNRPAIAVLWPSQNPAGFNIMLDVGADVRADARDLCQYALMGVSYARNGLNIDYPRVGVLNVGTEEHKGRAELKEAHALIASLADDANFEFVGFVEGGDIPGTKCDVIVTDGFTGNIALKTGEGTANLIGTLLREAFAYTPLSRLASLLALTSMRRLKKRIDPRRVNGGVFLGLNGTVVKSHGSADATGVSAAVKLAFQLAKSDFSKKVAARVASTPTLAQDETKPRTMVQNGLGMMRGFAYDVQAVCAGFVFALATANAQIVSGQAKRVMVIGAETFSRIMDWEDRTTSVLFGDGAGALILEAQDGTGDKSDRGILSVDLNSDGRHRDILYVDGGVSTQTTGYLRMQGKEVFRHAVEKLAVTAQTAMDRAKITADEVDWV
ncbi:MAG: phosphate acyltransferase PlsX, partial [Rhodobacteraceae bacterium]|nr:phosphate acyltransferase PlsX [Paracoccaceae bacterium]